MNDHALTKSLILARRDEDGDWEFADVDTKRQGRMIDWFRDRKYATPVNPAFVTGYLASGTVSNEMFSGQYDIYVFPAEVAHARD